jgi:hypothetical protein
VGSFRQQFIDGYVKAARIFGIEYTPIVNGIASLFQGGAAFPGNDWTMFTGGEDYLSRIPAQSHRALGRIRAFVRRLEHDGRRSSHDVVSFDCR